MTVFGLVHCESRMLLLACYGVHMSLRLVGGSSGRQLL